MEHVLSRSIEPWRPLQDHPEDGEQRQKPTKQRSPRQEGQIQATLSAEMQYSASSRGRQPWCSRSPSRGGGGRGGKGVVVPPPRPTQRLLGLGRSQLSKILEQRIDVRRLHIPAADEANCLVGPLRAKGKGSFAERRCWPLTQGAERKRIFEATWPACFQRWLKLSARFLLNP